MNPTATLAVLAAALAHAGWNAALKRQGDPLIGAFGIAVGALVACALAAPLLPLPAAKCWPWIAASIAVHVIYFSFLSLAYARGGLGALYPIMRGSPPLLVAAASLVVIGERIPPNGWIGIISLCSGLFLLVSGRPSSNRAMILALATAICTGIYTLIDGQGSRIAGNVASYIVWQAIGQSIVFAGGVFLLRATDCIAHLKTQYGQSFAAGAISTGGYATVLWAMGRAPIAEVAALRESSVVFAMFLGAFWLKEPIKPRQWLAAALVAAGAAVMHLH